MSSEQQDNTQTKPHSAAAPVWFKEAIASSYEIKQASIGNARIEYFQWGTPDQPLLILVHGNGGHANWWDFIAPSLTEKYCVCALHLGGMGNSDPREEYSFDSFAEDIIAVANHAGYEKDITVVGHSMGGVATIRAAENYPDQIKSIVVIDSPLIFRRSDEESEQHKPERPSHHKYHGKKYYPDFDTLFNRYRLVPEQPCQNQYLLDHVARHSIKETEQGWCWKFDEGIYFNFKRKGPPITVENIQCPMEYIYGSQSALIPEATIPDLTKLIGHLGNIHKIEGAHHHVMLDEPLALTEKLQEILGT